MKTEKKISKNIFFRAVFCPARYFIRKYQSLRSLGFYYQCRIGAKLAGATLIIRNPGGFNVPVRVDGQGIVEIGENVGFGYRPATRLGSGEILLQARTPTSKVEIGSKSIFNNNVSLIANQSIIIGSDCQIGDLVSIMDSDFHEISPMTRNCSAGACADVRIGSNVWLGSRVIVLKGVEIGEGSVVAAGSIVTKSIPSCCIAAGVPAKVVRAI